MRSGTNGRNEGKNIDRHCKLCGDESGGVVHVLWLYMYIHFEEFSTPSNLSRAGYILGCDRELGQV